MAAITGIARSDFMIVLVGETLDDVTRRLLEMTLRSYDWNKVKTAAALGVSVKTVYNRMEVYGLDLKDPLRR